MIAVIGTKSTNELIETVLGTSRKNYQIAYYDYTNTSQIETIVIENPGIEGILFSGIVGLKAYEAQESRSSIPYEMITIDALNYVLRILEIVLEYKDISVERIYLDYIGFLRKYQKDFYDILPVSFTKQVKGFEFDDLSEMTRENIYEDIRQKYQKGEIDVAIVSAAKISDELEALGITYMADYYIMDEYVLSSFNRLVKDIERHQLNSQKNYAGVMFVKGNETRSMALKALETYEAQSKVTNVNVNEELISFVINSEEVYISQEKVYCKLIEDLMNKLPHDLNIGVGVGRTRIESEHNAVKALKYAKAYGNRKNFIITDEKFIIGPLNDPYSLSVNEYQLEARYEQARSLGIKGFNLCRLMALYEKKKLLNTEIVMSYLNIAHRSSNRILTILEKNGIVEEGYERTSSRVGRPSKKYRLIT